MSNTEIRCNYRSLFLPEFIKVDEKESALEVLNDVLRSRKHRGKWTSTHESIMLLFTQLCIDLHRSSYAKDGLYQYRNICKEANPSSFEKVCCSYMCVHPNAHLLTHVQVVKEFLENAEKKASAARQQSEQAVLQDVEDLDYDITPERCGLFVGVSSRVRTWCDR